LAEVVSIPSNPRDAAYLECVTILEQLREFGGVILEELFKKAAENNQQVKSYFGINKPLRNDKNYKTRAVYHMLLNHQNIRKISDKPIVLRLISSNKDSLSDVSDVSEVQNSGTEKNNEFDQADKQSNNFIPNNSSNGSHDNGSNQSNIDSKNKELNNTIISLERKSQNLTYVLKDFSIDKNLTSDTSDTSDTKLIINQE
jgi:hypothetical protein